MAKIPDHYDIIIIGAGIAGLYSAYNIKPMGKSFLILEKNKKQQLGGRAVNDYFYNHEVTTGAGIGRKRSDHLLMKLAISLKCPYTEFKTAVDLASDIKLVDIMKTIDELKTMYKKHPELRHKTFKEFFIAMFNKRQYDNFVLNTGYTDYENADTYDTLYHYTMQDIIPGWTGIFISWTELIIRLYNYIGYIHFKFSTEVTGVKKTSDMFEINTNSQTYYSNKIIVATTIAGILKIVPYNHSLYRQIHMQPFIRVYAKFNKESSDAIKLLIKHYTILKAPLQKIIPIDADKGIYMIAYSDNKHAVYLKKYILNTTANRKVFCHLLEDALSLKIKLTITAIRSYYWDIGTHYYEPLHGDFKNREDFIHHAQRPCNNMVVVGEAVSIHQGWVEGALESVHSVITKKWLAKC